MSLNKSEELTHLELLPAELQCQILRSIPNMKALRTLLRASPRYFQVYRTCRKVVLSHVTWNNITPAVVPIALDVLEQRDNRRYGLIRTQQFASQRTLKEPHEIPFETWVCLLQFHRIVDSFVSSFASSRLVALENSMHPQTQTFESPGRPQNLSQLEYGRLARAFYHLELYSCLFYDHHHHSNGQVDEWDLLKRAVTFLQSLRDWELEELLCVRSYMMGRLIDYLNKFEEDFMEAYLKDRPCIIWPSRDSPCIDRNVLFGDYDNIQGQWIENSLTRGLESLSAMFSANKLSRRFNALWQGDYHAMRMNYALNRMQPYSEAEVMAKMEKSSEIGVYDEIEQPNEAWFWAIKFYRYQTFRELIISGDDTNEFESWGYLFWDNTRLERLGILTKSPSDISATIGTDWLIKKTPRSLETRTREQEEIWLQEKLEATLTEPRPVFDWDSVWFE